MPGRQRAACEMSAFWDPPLMLQGVLTEEAAEDMCRAPSAQHVSSARYADWKALGGRWPPGSEDSERPVLWLWTPGVRVWVGGLRGARVRVVDRGPGEVARGCVEKTHP